jgi:hypothetical protein
VYSFSNQQYILNVSIYIIFYLFQHENERKKVVRLNLDKHDGAIDGKHAKELVKAAQKLEMVGEEKTCNLKYNLPDPKTFHKFSKKVYANSKKQILVKYTLNIP